MSEPLPLPGCTPEPLMSYLKALGVFRLVAEQTDPDARLSWCGGVACLHTKLTQEELATFFLEEYQPTPIMTPWNSASGFAPTKTSNKAPKDKAARKAASTLVASELPRLRPYSEAISNLQGISRGDEDATTWKQDYFMRCRASLPDNVVRWLDTCFSLTNTDLSSFPLLGSGGNDGVTDFGSLFMQRLCQVIEVVPTDTNKGWLRSAIYSDGHEPMIQDTVGQFNPGGIGGANATQGNFEAKSQVNPWDFVLMVEGALLFAGSVARRMGSNNVGDYAAFPFCVQGIAVGNGSFSEKEARERGKEPPNGGELWLPLWSKEVGILELKHLYSEGRAQFGRRQARNAVEFGLAVNLLGVSKGVDSFSRMGFLRRNGKAFLATPLGRVVVHERPNARLLSDLALLDWLDRFRNACRENDGKRDKIPARYKTALRNIDRTIFAFSNRSEQGNDAKYLLDVLRVVGQAERVVATQGLSFFKDKQFGWRIQPLQGLNSQWPEQIYDSAEFRLAASLAGIRPVLKKRKMQVGQLRHYLEPVEGDRFINWTKSQNFKTSSAVWSRQPLDTNLAVVFRRRQMEAFREGIAGIPLYSPIFARLDDVIAFLNNETDDDKLCDLLWGLIGIDWSKVKKNEWMKPERPIPTEFGIPRLVVQNRFFGRKTVRVSNRRLNQVQTRIIWRLSSESEPNAKPDPHVFHILTSGRGDAVTQCVDRAARRLKSGGLLVCGYRNRRQAGKSLAVLSPFSPERLLASMLFPLSNRDLQRIANSVLYPPESEE